MKKSMELKEERMRVWTEAKTFLKEHEAKDGTLSAEDTTTYERMETKIQNLTAAIERYERQEKLDEKLGTPDRDPEKGQPGAGAKDTEDKKGTASAVYTKAFWNAMRRKNYFDVRNELSVGVDTEGGYLVPDEFERTLIEALEEDNFFRSLATTIKTSSGDRKIPVVTAKGEAEWIDEAEEYPFSDNTFGQVTLSAYKLATIIKISEELLNDSAFDMSSYIAKEFGRRIAAKEEESFIVGDGSGKPTGVFTSTDSIVTGSSSDITFDDVIDMFYSLRSPYRKKAVWIMNDSTVKALRLLKDNNGQYIWEPSVKAGEPDRILNRPFYTSSYVPEIATGNNVLAFGDFSYYWIADRTQRTLKRLNEIYAPTGQVGFLTSETIIAR
ncbi:MAG: phage major capsid protein [Eubacterium sp.]|nr:phage major capsid protein [Eubacterium sp.]